MRFLLRDMEIKATNGPSSIFQIKLGPSPAERMKKTKKPHRVPLSAPAMTLLAHQWEYRKSEQLVFTGRNRTSRVAVRI
jgi:integrase